MKVSELLSDESKWTTRYLSRNKNDNPVYYDDNDACKWCLLGAMLKCYEHNGYEKVFCLTQRTIGGLIGTFNDASSYEQVMKLVRELDI